MALAVRSELNFSGGFQNSVHAIPAFATVVHQRDMVPGTERMSLVFVEQYACDLPRLCNAIQEPPVACDADFQQQSRFRIFARLRIALLKIEKALFWRAVGIGT